MITHLQEKITDLMNEIRTNTQLDLHSKTGISIHRLLSRLGNINITERVISDDNAAVALTRDKMDIELCLFDRDKHPVDEDALFSVLVHELAHIAEEDTSPLLNGHSVHSPLFKNIESYMLSVGVRIGFIPVGGTSGMPYCDIRIPDADVAQ
jgi:hypothetical protein